jgi:uncharacterized protein (DUF2267 family)
MPVSLREDVAYIILKKIHESDGQDKHPVDFQQSDFTGRELTPSGFMGHLDYLNQKQYIEADFSGNAYATQEDVPAVVESKEVDLRVANTLGAPDGPLPHLIRFKRATLTDKGRKMLEKMEANPPQEIKEGPATPIATQNMPFLEKVMLKGEFEDIFDARDISTVVFRTMRDVMPTDAATRVEGELHKEAEPTADKTLQSEIADLWKDTNPIVSFLSRIRPPLNIKSDTFLFRIEQEAGLPQGITPEQALSAVFSATKEELSDDRVSEIAGFLPDKIKELWEQA